MCNEKMLIQTNETLCYPQILNQIKWKIYSEPLKKSCNSIIDFCTPFEKRYFDYLRISLNIIHDFPELCDGLPKNVVTLTFFDYDFDVDVDGIEESICKLLEQNNSLKKLKLKSCLLDQDKTMKIYESIKENESLKSLNLSGNDINDEGAISIINLFKENKTLENLNFESNSIGMEGIIYIAKILEQNQTLKILNLSNNQIKEEGVIHIALQNNALTKLNLSNNRFEDNGLKYIAKSLELNNC